MILRKSRELLAGLFAARLVDAHVGRSAPAAHQLAPFADRPAEDAVAAVLLAGNHEPQVDRSQLMHLGYTCSFHVSSFFDL